MNIKVSKEESINQVKKNIDLFDTLKAIPYTIQVKLQFIQKEIDDIIELLKNYESIKDKFNNKHFNIQNYIDEFLKSIKFEAESLFIENKQISKLIDKGAKVFVPEKPIVSEEPVITKNVAVITNIKTEVKNNQKIIPQPPVKKIEPEEPISIDDASGMVFTPGQRINLSEFETEGAPPVLGRDLDRFGNRF